MHGRRLDSAISSAGGCGVSGPPVAAETNAVVGDAERPELETTAGASRNTVRRMLRSAFGTAILQGVSTALGFLTAVLLARLLGQGGYGHYTYALAWAGFLTIPALVGMEQFLIRGIARYEVQRDWGLMKGLLRRTNQIVLLTSSVIAGVGCTVAVMWLSPSLVEPFCIAMALVPVTALTLLRQGAMQAIGRVVTGQMPEYLIGPLLILIGLGALVLIGGGALTATTALAAYLAGMAVAFIVGAVLLRRALPAVLRSVSPVYATLEWLQASLRIMLINGVWMTNRYVGILVLGTLDSPRATGVYGVVEKGAALIVMVHFAVNMPLAPAIARLHAQADHAGLERVTERMARVATLVSLPVCAAFAIFPGVYLSIFGPSFGIGATAMTILALAQLVNAATGPASNVLIMTGHERPAVLATAAGLLVNVVLGIALVPLLGMTGSAIAFASSLVFWNVALVILARRLIGVNATAFRRLAIATAARAGSRTAH
jgi:O-antigen/teichoic acid export membrane protein